MKINSKDFRVSPRAKVKLKKWPTKVKPFCKLKKRYQKLLEAHVELTATEFPGDRLRRKPPPNTQAIAPKDNQTNTR
jgi:hypothetical protein